MPEQELAALRALAREHLAKAPGSAYQRLLEQVEIQLLREALLQTTGDLSRAASLLGLSRRVLQRKLAERGLLPEGQVGFANPEAPPGG